VMQLDYAWRAVVRSPRRTAASVFGTFLAVGLLSSVLLFVDASARGMTQRTIAAVPVDMRANALTYDLNIPSVQANLLRQRGVVAALPLTLSHFASSAHSQNNSTFTTGAGAILAFDDAYLRAFPTLHIVQGQLAPSGIMLSLDMSTNLGAHVGDTVTLKLPGGAGEYRAQVTGIANMRGGDVLFAPTDPRLLGVAFNPPANVVVVPLSLFNSTLFARLRDTPPPQASALPGGTNGVIQSDVLPVDQQIHLKIDRSALAGDPTQAQVQTTQLRHALEKLYPGQLRVADELFAAIDTVKGDVLWAQVLFVFLAIPAVLLAAYLSYYMSQTLIESQEREFALLRARGATPRQLHGIVATMSLIVGLVGALLGLLGGLAVSMMGFGIQTPDLANWRLWVGTLAWSLLAGILVAGLSTYLPARQVVVAEILQARRAAKPEGARPLWSRLYLDVAAIVAAVVIFRITQVNGFHPVLNAEGNPTISLSYYTLLAPLLFWFGAAFLLIRVGSGVLQRSAQAMGRLLSPLFGEVGHYVATTTARRALPISKAAIVVALALSFGFSISVFAATYSHQQRVDAELTLGSDVKVTPVPGHPQVAAFAQPLARTPGVSAATPFKTTVAYVGTEIQDIFGVDVASLRRATNLPDAFFQGATATDTMNRLAATPDGILVSAETARDYSIVVGDRMTIRIFNRNSQTYQDAHFTVAGVASEFPTAPKDAFLVVNLHALTAATADPAISFFLLKAPGSPATLARTLQTQLGTGVAETQSIDSVVAQLATSLTSLNLNGLAVIEYLYTILIVSAGAMVFVLALLAERRREFATMRAVGTVGRQLAAFVISEAALISMSGLVAGMLIGAALSFMLVMILTSLFDPPPAWPIPNYAPLAFLVGGAIVALVAAVVVATLHLVSARVSDVLRDA
jgi:putative ABC transport system permease protein